VSAAHGHAQIDWFGVESMVMGTACHPVPNGYARAAAAFAGSSD
jgi:hypothetical protein